MAATLEDKPKTERLVDVQSFTIEADHPRNSDLMLQSVVGCVLRSALTGMREGLGLDYSQAIASFPKTPGMQLQVNPSSLSYRIFDPLTEDPDKCEQIRKWILAKHAVKSRNMKVVGVKTSSGKLDPHRMKTLVRECRNLLNLGHAKIVKGVVPDLETIALMPGKFLLNPGATVQNMQPTFEDDWNEWYEQLKKAGG